MIRDGQTAFCSYVLDQMALHVYLQKVICGKNETSLVHVRFLSGIGSESIAIFKHKNVHTMHFLFVFKLLFKDSGTYRIIGICLTEVLDPSCGPYRPLGFYLVQ